MEHIALVQSLVNARGTGILAHDSAVRPFRQCSVGSARLIRVLRFPRRKVRQGSVPVQECRHVSAPFVGRNELQADKRARAAINRGTPKQSC